MLGSANRDPEPVAGADRLDLTRGSTPHVASGHDVHHCLGTALTRPEATTALRRILARLPDLRLDVPVDELQWLPAAPAFRGLLQLPLRSTPTPSPSPVPGGTS